MPPKILVICGPTASGKTALAVELALRHHGEVVSADSMQIYRRMDIGTAKPTREEMRGVPHHMLDVADPEEDFSVARYVDMAAKCVDDILSRGKLPILAGGTGLYIDSLLSGRTFAPFQPDSPLRGQLEEQLRREGGAAMLARLAQVDPDSAARLHPNDEKRIIRALEVYQSTGKTITQHNLETQALPDKYHPVWIGLTYEPRQLLYDRIDLRVDKMLEAGLLEEIRGLLERGIPSGCTAMQAIGYKEFLPVLNGAASLETAVEQVKQGSRRYAKRQLTWFRRNPNIHWILQNRETTFSDVFSQTAEQIPFFDSGI